MSEVFRMCKDCHWWGDFGDVSTNEGRCHRNAPLPISIKDDDDPGPKGYWPWTQADDWCGEFKERDWLDDEAESN